jgi:hypothetical protein
LLLFSSEDNGKIYKYIFLRKGMKNIQLEPNQIIVPGEYELGSEAILKIYFRMFDKGHGKDLPPVIVTPKTNHRDYEALIKKNTLKKGSFAGYIIGPERAGYLDIGGALDYFKKRYNLFDEKIGGATHYLMDGNHRSVAAALTHQPVSALELQTDKDLEEVRNLAEQGHLTDFNRKEESLSGLISSFEEYCLDNRHTKTVQERVDELTSNGDLPQYMKDRYLEGK